MISFQTVDLALNAGTTALLLLLAALLIRDARGVAAGRLAAALALGSAAHAVSAAGFTAPVAAWRAPLIALSTGNVVVLWLFARALFDDGFALRWWHALPWAAMVVLSLVNCLLLFPVHVWPAQMLGAGLNVIALGFVVLAVAQAVASWPVDLVEARRRLRLAIVAAAAAYGAINAVLQLALFGGAGSDIAATANAGLLAAIVVGLTLALTRIDGAGLFVAPALPRPVAEPARDIRGDLADAADQRLIKALNRLMADDRIYRHEGVTIGSLATRLAVPEYRLRRLINQRLGHRNFNVFLNDHRIAEVKAALADPAQVEVPVITIAMDAGFQSLGPFNRAFKAATGLTPSEYRRRHAVPVPPPKPLQSTKNFGIG
jgi:AraC-like DNA-binding protein